MIARITPPWRNWLCVATLGIFSLSASATEPAVVAPTTLPGSSVYQLPINLVDQDGRPFKLTAKRGQPLIVSMFYNSCEFVCPMLIDTIRATENSLTQDERKQLNMLLVTFDPARDDVATLKSVAGKRELDLTHWTLARTDASAVRKLAATLGIQYRLLPSGEYNHTTVLILLDDEGRIIGRTAKIGTVDPAFLKLIRQATQAKQGPN